MTQEPIPMPPRAGHWSEQMAHYAGLALRRARTESERINELLRAVRTHEGRRSNLRPLLVLAAGGGFLLGLALGWRRR
ncbi:MAG TPA: hypothetical protein VN690_14265 [Terriglobales bacterium]|nr:hypothetical protein [Terriglobales bacterium]